MHRGELCGLFFFLLVLHYLLGQSLPGSGMDYLWLGRGSWFWRCIVSNFTTDYFRAFEVRK